MQENLLNQMKYPTIDTIQSALFIQPHPDDNEIGAGGTIAYLRAKGVPVYVVTVTKGDGGSKLYSPEELTEIRHKEALHAAEILDVEYMGNLGFSNTNPGTEDTICASIVEVIRKCRPHAIFSVDPNLPNETHPVHIRVGNAVKQAFMRAGQTFYPFADNVERPDAFTPEILGQYFTEDETTILDISAFYDLKLAAIQAHVSQVDASYLAMLDSYYAVIAQGTAYHRVERLKLLSSVHTHCFALPKEIRALL